MEQFEYSSLFGELTKSIQAIIDEASKKQAQLFSKQYFEQDLSWDTPTLKLTFEEIIGQYGLSVIAPTIGDNSKEPIMSPKGLETLAGKVFKHSFDNPMTEQRMRKYMELKGASWLNDKTKDTEMTNLMWGDVKTVVNSVLDKIDTIYLGQLSNEGVFTFNNDNNPEGGVKESIDFKQPSDNIHTAATQWTTENIATVDCMEDIMEVIDAASNKVKFEKIKLSPARLRYICKTAKIRSIIWGSNDSARPVQLQDLNDYMQSNDLPVFEVINKQVAVQNGQSLTPLTPWNGKNLVFVPGGKLGVVKVAVPMNQLMPESTISYSNYGNIRIAKWRVGEAQGSNTVEHTKAECTALPVVTEFSGIHTLKSES